MRNDRDQKSELEPVPNGSLDGLDYCSEDQEDGEKEKFSWYKKQELRGMVVISKRSDQSFIWILSSS